MYRQMDFAFDEPLDRLEERALAGLAHGIAALKRQRRTLPRWIRKGDSVDAAKAIAALAAIQTALTFISPYHMGQLARRVRRKLPKDP
jgi:hypothetical protein